MAELVAAFMAGIDVPLTAPGTLPTINVRRIDTGASVSSGSMVEVGDGWYSFTFATSATLEYTWRADGDPIVAGQTIAGGRYVFGAISGITDARIEVDIPQILVDTTALLVAVAAVPAATDVVLTAAHGAGAWTGTPAAAVATAVWSEPLPGAFGGGTAGFHLDTTVSSRSDFDETTDPVELLDAGGAAGTSAAELVADIGADLSATHGAGSWLSAAPPSVAAIVAGVWSEPLPGAFLAGSAGFHLDAPVSGVPAATDVVLSAAHGAGSWLSAVPPTAAAIAAAVWSESLGFGLFGAGEAGTMLYEFYALYSLQAGEPSTFDTSQFTVPGAGITINITTVGTAKTGTRV